MSKTVSVLLLTIYNQVEQKIEDSLLGKDDVALMRKLRNLPYFDTIQEELQQAYGEFGPINQRTPLDQFIERVTKDTFESEHSSYLFKLETHELYI